MNDFQLNKGQSEAIKNIKNWYNTDGSKQVFYCVGAAGTGKSTAINYVIHELGLDLITEVLFGCYTGKASLVLRDKGLNAITLHKMLYEPIEHWFYVLDKDGKKIKDKYDKTGYKTKVVITFSKRNNLEKQYEFIKLIVIDECSMMDKELFDDIKSIGKKIILLGDTNQLPPIYGNMIVELNKPDYCLTEIVRQAADNPIIYLSQLAIKGERLKFGNYDNKVKVTSSQYVSDEDMINSNIIIVGKNKTRDAINAYYREQILNIDSKYPVKNDKIICKRNNWEIVIQDDRLGTLPLLNGLIGNITRIERKHSKNRRSNPDLLLDFKPIDYESEFKDLKVNSDILNYRDISFKERRELIDFRSQGSKFEYAYAITCHSSQGSEWDNVLFNIEYFMPKDKMKKFIYTGITRAKEKLIIAY